MKKQKMIIAANSAKVRIFTLEIYNMLVEIKTFVHPEGRMHEQDFLTDRQGEFETTTVNGHWRYAAEPKTTAKEHENALFAKEVAEFLEKKRQEGVIEKIYLASSPTFLGLLRQEMSPSLSGLIETTIDKDVTNHTPEKIKEYFPIGL
jgi:protein required for attachment to host cells